MDIGPAELVIVLVIALVLFGGKKLPELARSLGQARSEFEKGTRGEDESAAAEPEAVGELPAPEAESDTPTSSSDAA